MKLTYGSIEGTDRLRSAVAALYDRGISTGSMSKAFALAGLCLGWAVAPASLIRELTIHRDYNTISVGMVDDLLASTALLKHDLPLPNPGVLAAGLPLLSDYLHSH